MPPYSPLRALGVAAAAALIATAAACGGPSGDAAAPESTTGQVAQAFPVTIEHEFGTTTIPAKPTRVVAVGFNEADFVLAFGVQPLGVRDFIGEFQEEARPWAQQALGGTQPVNVGNEINFEKVAALDPDLILGLYSFVDKTQYDKLAAIAPTVGPVSKDGNIDWKQQTLLTGKALGQEDKARELVAGVERKFADAKAANRAFQGKKLGVLFSVDTVVKENRTVWFGGFETDFAGALGFTSPLSLPFAVDLAAPKLAAAVR